MSDRGPVGSDSRRSFAFLRNPFFWLISGAALLLCTGLDREMWFDEVLTLTNFAPLDSAAEIYRRYTIPNNHIVFTLFLHNWMRLFPGLSDAGLRLLSAFAALGTVTALWYGFRKETGEAPLMTALAAWMVSPGFTLYGTAVRGYMLCTFFTVLALIGGKAFLAGKKYGAAVWFAGSFLAVGTIPSALAAIGGAGILLLPPEEKWRSQWQKILLLALLPFAAFALFYVPILPQLLHCASLGEGSADAVSASGALMIGIVSSFGILVMTAGRRRKWLSRRDPVWLVWLIPVAAILLLPKAPFPRIFFPFFPIFALLVARTLKRHSQKTLTVLLAAVIVWGGVQKIPVVSTFLSSLCARAGQDDFIAPRFMRKEFVPSQTANTLSGCPRIFVTFDADPWAVLWALSRQNALPQEFLFDGPRGRIQSLLAGTAVVSTHEEKNSLETRFGIRLVPVAQTSLHKIWQVAK